VGRAIGNRVILKGGQWGQIYPIDKLRASEMGLARGKTVANRQGRGVASRDESGKREGASLPRRPRSASVPRVVVRIARALLARGPYVRLMDNHYHLLLRCLEANF